MIGAAAAAGRRVAWIETRVTRAGRVVVVRAVRVGAGGRVLPLRRLVVARDQSDRVGWADVLVTARGDLAWIAPRFDRDTRVGYAPPRGRPRTVATGATEALSLEDRVTLAWYGDSGMGFYDMRRPAGRGCPHRSAFHRIAASGTVIVTEAGFAGGERQVLRACVRATGRDRMIAQADNGFGNGDRVDVVGLDRRWVIARHVSFTRYDPCPSFGRQRPVDARTGRLGRATEARPCTEFPSLAQAGLPVAVTDRGVAAWIVEQEGARRLLAAAPGGGVTELDRGAIDGLRAQGTAVAWTRDGEPRSARLP